MIENIVIRSVACYGDKPNRIDGLSNNNFFYGANGSGKTTISRVIANENDYADCSVTWRGGTKLETLVYNRDFVEANFNSDDELKGIFTLGEKNETELKAIAEAKDEADKLRDEITGKKKTLSGEDGDGGKLAELKTLDDEFKEQCWALKTKYDESFEAAFKGTRGKKQDFKARLVSESEGNKANLEKVEDLQERCGTVFADDIEKQDPIPPIIYSDLVELESSPIFSKKVIGKEDVDIAAMIKKLGNSDWVKQGKGYFDGNDGICPFCQQDTDEAFAASLNEYFDETYIKDITEIDQLATNYGAYADVVLERLSNILVAKPIHLDCEKLAANKDLLDARIKANREHIAKKKEEPSIVITLESLEELIKEIEESISDANKKINAHNAIVDNLAKEKTKLTSKVWRFIVEEAKTIYGAYKSKKAGLDAAISGLSDGIKAKTEEKNKKEAEIRTLEKNITSIKPTINEINALLASFGFTGFKLADAVKAGCYQIIRPDGSEAKDTLSEGESSFITFLYFYHLLKGSTSESGMTEDRVVVFDDPVSSLDSDILFIVSNLIKALFEDIRTGTGHIKQVFVLTHNVYFHKEVSFNPKRSGVAMNEETFWVVKKAADYSRIEKHTENPVKTSYEMLWGEVRCETPSSLTIQNTLRRILENYFKIFGNVDNEEIINKFEGKEKQVCGSLFTWVNAGSHDMQDDLYVSCDVATIETYLRVFRRIFNVSGHEAHYNMMMGIEGDENVSSQANDNQEHEAETHVD
ncbi:MAG: AAA family ATPase [Candidatus Thiodiazotropha sp. (ex Monitilora ramsayi)]|nr:AAA family ATPase [Candidatus Thiodiazotropha sp. (ex Monitilora ramsayi)]